ncbi:MAG: ADP-ribosylglycohydrolase family protein [Tannerellaceae bacterium]|nr:ADP-ribosylglycohydrolase family protein [Tannerellaceae bacterium]
MKVKLISIVFAVCFFPGMMKSIFAQSGKIILPKEVVVDKIRGGLLGQILGNLNGLSHEMAHIAEPGNVMNYVPALPDGARTDDDTDFEWLYIYEMQKNRELLLDADYIRNIWIERINKGVWCSNRFTRYLMDFGFKPPYTGYTEFNPWADFNISGQFLCETFGLLAPAMPQTAAKTGLNYTTVAIGGEPAQTTQLFTTMISMAFIESDINKILDAGIASLDSKSKIVLIINDIKKWYAENPADWRKTRSLLKEKYTAENGRLRDRNGYELNTGSIIAALLYGGGDFAETLKLAFNFGWDADCNAATVGTIMGVKEGYRKMMTTNRKLEPSWLIVDRYKNTTRDNMPMDETITSFADRLVELFELVNENNGGSQKLKDKVLVYEITTEKPAPVMLLAGADNKNILRERSGKQITDDLSSRERAVRAKAAFMAVCLEMDEQLSKTHAKSWKTACYDLSGYWKVINNIFEGGDAQVLYNFSAKFAKAGFKPLRKKYSDQDIYNDKEFWKAPETLY